MKNQIFQVNSYYEGLIQNLYGGSKGCAVAFMQFFYQYNQSVIFKPALSECFLNLYETELENCKILSQLLIKMNGDNKFFSASRKFLSGYNVDYVKNFEKMFLSDIEFLEISVIELKSLLCKIDDQEIKKQLKLVLENKKDALKKLKEKFFKDNLIN